MRKLWGPPSDPTNLVDVRVSDNAMLMSWKEALAPETTPSMSADITQLKPVPDCVIVTWVPGKAVGAGVGGASQTDPEKDPEKDPEEDPEKDPEKDPDPE